MISATANPGGYPVEGPRRQGFVPLPALTFALILLLTGCAYQAPPRTATTAALSGSLQRQARAADAAHDASRKIRVHLDGLGNDISRVDGKAALIKSWLEGQP